MIGEDTVTYMEKVSGDVELEDSSSGEVITHPFSPRDIKLSTPPMNLGDLIEMIQAGWINFNTEYQRSMNLWSPQQQSRLIESVLLGLRLPAFYFEVIHQRKWNIIDGLQRCCAIMNFCVDKSLSLEGLEFLADFEGKSFDDLTFETRRDIRMLPITVNLLEPGAPDQVKYILFKRLNTGGLELNSQEIRNAVYQGKPIDIVRDLSKMDCFIQATCGKISSDRCLDMDFISRFVAFYWLGYENYQPDLDRFLNQSMEELRDYGTDERVVKMKQDFENAMQLSMDVFGDRAFRKQQCRDEYRRPINKAYFEVISSQFALFSEEKRKAILEVKGMLVDNLHTAMRDSKSFQNSFSSGTGNRDAVKRRFTWFLDIVERSLSNIKIQINDDNRIENM